MNQRTIEALKLIARNERLIRDYQLAYLAQKAASSQKGAKGQY